jgi:transglutaminase 1
MSNPSKALKVKNINFCIDYNGKEHHTDRFDLMKRKKDFKLVVRRGQGFRLRLNLDRPYDKNCDSISLMFSVADVKKPTFGHGTLIAVPMKNWTNDENNMNEWFAIIESSSENMLELLVWTPGNALVTRWKFDIDTKLIKSRDSKSFRVPKSIYVLFNPWSPVDEVYLEGLQ